MDPIEPEKKARASCFQPHWLDVNQSGNNLLHLYTFIPPSYDMITESICIFTVLFSEYLTHQKLTKNQQQVAFRLGQMTSPKDFLKGPWRLWRLVAQTPSNHLEFSSMFK